MAFDKERRRDIARMMLVYQAGMLAALEKKVRELVEGVPDLGAQFESLRGLLAT
jgi:hypothetical protein